MFRLLGLLLITGLVQAQSLDISPLSPTPKGTMLLDAGGLTPAILHEFELLGGSEPVLLGSAVPDRTGTALLDVALPDVSPGIYQIGITVGRVLIDQTSLTVAPGPNLQLETLQGSPGSTVGFTTIGLQPGQVEIRFDGLRVFGPGVVDGDITGQFEVPLGTDPESNIQLRNQIGSILSGLHEQSFLVLPGDGRLTPVEVSEVVLPPDPLRPDVTQQVSGVVSLPSQVLANPETHYSLFMEVCGDGSVVPTPNRGDIEISCVNVPADIGNFTLSPEGVFSADVSQLSLLFGDAVPPASDGQTTNALGLAYASPEISGSTTFGLTSGAPLANETFTVVVTDTLGFPLENALVAVLSGALVDPECGSPDCPPTSASTAPLFQAESQVKWWLESNLDFELTGLNTCPTSLYRDFTDASGERTFSLNPQQLTQGALWAAAISNNSPDINTTIPSYPRYFGIEILINGLATDAGAYGVTLNDGTATGIVFDLFYDVKDNRFYAGQMGADLASGSEPLEAGYVPIAAGATLAFALEPVDATDAQFPTRPWMPGLTQYEKLIRGEDENNSIPVFRNLVQTGQPANVDLLIGKSAEVRIKHDEFVFGVLESLNLEIDGLGAGNPTFLQLQPTAPTAGNCEPGGVEYRATIPDAHLLPPGPYGALLTGQVGNDGPTYSRYFEFVVEAMPSWISASPNLTDQRIIWTPEEVRLFADEVAATTKVDVTPDPNYDVGTLQNDSTNEAFLIQRLGNDGFGDFTRFASSDNLAINEDAGVESSNTPINGQGPFEESITIPEFEILDSGKIPLFRYGWGFWPIAEATVGADFWFKVLFEAYGRVRLIGEQMVNDMVAMPSVQAGIDLFIDASILFDIVDISIAAIPFIEMRMIAVQGPLSAASCESFDFNLNAKYEVSVGICPLCLESADTVPLINEPGNPSCQPPVLDGGGSSNLDGRGRPVAARPSGRVAVASNGRGRSLRAYTEPDGSLIAEISAAGGQQNLVVYSADDLRGITSMDVAWLSRNRAVMVWSQSTLDAGTFEALRNSLAGPADSGAWQTAIAAQQLYYAIYDDGFWSDPLPLTSSGLGEGGVQLASCQPDGNRGSNCPINGEILLVFSRDLDNSLTGNQRTFFSTFDGFNWSPAAPLDPGSTAKENQPDAAYIDGEPIAVWVRNPGRTLATVNQRSLAYRFLNSEQVGTVPVDLSQGVASPSVAGDSLGKVNIAYTVAQDSSAFLGNRRSLHFAIGDCSTLPCSWVETELLDDFDRKIWAERPQLEITPGNLAIIGFRHLGYGSLSNAPVVRATDSLGATLGTGDLAMITLQLDTGFVHLDPLTDNAQAHFLPDLSYDPALDSLDFVSVLGGPPSSEVLQGRRGQAIRPSIPTRGRQTRLGNDLGPAFIQTSRQTDLAISGLDVAPRGAGLPDVRIQVAVENLGAAFNGNVELALSWNGPGQSGLPISTLLLPDPGLAGASFSVDASFPKGVTGDHTQTLYALIDPIASIADRNGENNLESYSIGGLKGPAILSARTSRLAEGVHLDWDDDPDPRVIGYRVYRSIEGEPFLAAGTTFASGYYDLTADSARPSEYYITSFTRSGIESTPGKSIALRAQPRRRPGEFIFSDRFMQ
ncbi:MAG: hypothetical protein AAGJ52_00240 [Pseudomonadota bacterium]